MSQPFPFALVTPASRVCFFTGPTPAVGELAQVEGSLHPGLNNQASPRCGQLRTLTLTLMFFHLLAIKNSNI